MTVAEQRSAIVAEAKTWLGTRWHHHQCVKGAGVDCANFVMAVYVAVGMAKEGSGSQYARYPSDWMLHRSEELMLECAATYGSRVEAPLPGDVAIWKYGRCFSHAGIVVDWPVIIHAFRPERAVVWGDGTAGALATERLKGGVERPREVRFYSRFAQIARAPAPQGPAGTSPPKDQHD